MLLGLSGCAGQNPFTQRQLNMGALKSNVARLETERDQLERQVAKLHGENERLGEQLAEERVRGDELATRLDNFRSEAGSLNASLPRDSIRAIPPSRITPAATPRRKTPFARIPGSAADASPGSGASTPPVRPRSVDHPPNIFDSMPQDPTDGATPLSRAEPADWRPQADRLLR
jgi:hypothetical protein